MINFIESSHTYWTEIDGASMDVPSVSTILTEMLGLDYAKINPFYADRGTAVHKPRNICRLMTLMYLICLKV